MSEFGAAGFVREKKVDLEEDGDEHVLYVQSYFSKVSINMKHLFTFKLF